MTSLRKKSTLKNVDSQVPKKLPESSFDEFGDLIEIPNGFISWKTFYDVYEKDSKLQANLRKAPKPTYGVIHLGNNK